MAHALLRQHCQYSGFLVVFVFTASIYHLNVTCELLYWSTKTTRYKVIVFLAILSLTCESFVLQLSNVQSLRNNMDLLGLRWGFERAFRDACIMPSRRPGLKSQYLTRRCTWITLGSSGPIPLPFYLPGNSPVSCIYVAPSTNIIIAAELIAEGANAMLAKYPGAPLFILGDFNMCRLDCVLPSL